ncbi:hypothetical protein LBGG_02018, partial [Lactobacillus gasseri MV-22]
MQIYRRVILMAEKEHYERTKPHV